MSKILDDTDTDAVVGFLNDRVGKWAVAAICQDCLNDGKVNMRVCYFPTPGRMDTCLIAVPIDPATIPDNPDPIFNRELMRRQDCVQRALTARDRAFDILHETEELNMSNYNEDDVAQLNDGATAAYLALKESRAALAEGGGA